jgi:hypothetical protein
MSLHEAGARTPVTIRAAVPLMADRLPDRLQHAVHEVVIHLKGQHMLDDGRLALLFLVGLPHELRDVGPGVEIGERVGDAVGAIDAPSSARH